MSRKTKLLKSKSSNTGITRVSSPPRKKNKKSLSNADIKPLVLRKRGVYVEKNSPNAGERSKSPPLRQKSSNSPRADKKSFLNSVLTILSKSTTGTQCPDVATTQDTTVEKIKKKPKYRSKYITDSNRDFSQIVILQSTKEIVHTPSIHSASNAIVSSTAIVTPQQSKWLEPKVSIKIAENKNIEIKKPPEKKVTIIADGKQESTTVITDLCRKDDKNMYNFFVDLLHTTINDVDGDFEVIDTTSIGSKTHLEIDEAVANKLTFKKSKNAARLDTKASMYRKQSSQVLPNNNLILGESYLKLSEFYQQNGPPKTRPKNNKRKKMHVCINRTAKRQPPPPKPKAKVIKMEPYKPLSTGKLTKKQFINSLKEELRVEDGYSEEPQSSSSFFQALKVMARTKKINEPRVYFDDQIKPTANDHIYNSKRRSLLSKYPNRNRDYRKVPRSIFPYKKKNTFRILSPKISDARLNDNASDHSIEVYGFHYDQMPTISVSTYHSTSSVSVNNLAETRYEYANKLGNVGFGR